jgi:hypothetical protein
MKYFYLIASFLFLSTTSIAQNDGQALKGTVTDKQSQTPLASAAVFLQLPDTTIRTLTDAQGNFKFEHLTPGRYELIAKFIGYKQANVPNIIVTAGKEVVVDITMEENVKTLKQIVISGTKKQDPINELTTVSARSFSTEEVNRFAGGRSDPSRMAANFAGVSSPNDARNDIVIRGNSPTGVLWRIEGLNIPNPNHFSTIGTTGGPVSALNTNMLKNSDFFTSAFPSEYGNANAGVFDLGFRKGNADKREHTFQIGALTGIEAMTEGPINKEKGSSYLVAYRYAFTGVAQKIGIPIGTAATPFYQDISFKISSGQTKYGKFVLFGLGGVSHIVFDHNKVDTTDLFAYPNRDSYFKSRVGLVGLNHFIRVNDKAYFRTIIGATLSGSDYDEDTINKQTNEVTRVIENQTNQLRYSINTSYNHKVNSKLFLKIGVLEELLHLNLTYRNRTFTPTWVEIWNFNDLTSLIQGYAHAKYSFSDRVTLNAGLHYQHLTLNNTKVLEPRVGLKIQVNEKGSLNLGFGQHSQMQPTDVYFYRTQLNDGSYLQSNKNLDFTKSLHYVIGYDYNPVKDWRIKTEVYYQHLFNVPVSSADSAYSILNAGANFNPNEMPFLVNQGTGENYGAELTIEKFFSKGYYALLTGSIYESKYTGMDKVERNTGFNGKYVYNVLIGKEFLVGKDKQNRITIDFKLTQAGGRYYTPVDLDASNPAGKQVEKGREYAYTERISDFFRMDAKIGFVLNHKKVKMSQSWFFDIQNITNHQNVFALRYNPIYKSINTAYQIGLFPNFVYKIQF